MIECSQINFEWGNSNGKYNLIPRDRTHGNTGEHRHGRGKGDIRADDHCHIVNRSATHGEDHNHKSNNE